MAVAPEAVRHSWQDRRVIIAAFPGQGSQTPGFLIPWLELDGISARLDRYSDWAEVDLRAAGTEWDADAIRATEVAQPLIVAASLLSWNTLPGREHIAGVAGHSVGEFAAAAAAGILSEEDALRLVGVRGRAMAAAAAAEQTGMRAVVGGKPDDVLATVERHGLTAANHNGGGQVVAAGTITALDALSEDPPRGARVIPLQVAGAFHTTYMSSAVATLQGAAQAVTARDPDTLIWSNRDGAPVATGADFMDSLIAQVASPVRWDLCMEAFASSGITGLIELAPAGALTGLAKRGLRGTPTVAVKAPDDLTAVTELLGANAQEQENA